MSKLFFTVGATTTESIDPHQPVWALLPETTTPAVVSTYARQIYPGTQVLLWLGSVRNIFHRHFLPRLKALEERSLKSSKPEYAAMSAEIEAFAGDQHRRAQIFLSYLSARRRIDDRLYPVIEKIARRAALTRKDTTPLVDALCTAVEAPAALTIVQKHKLQDFIDTGGYDRETLLWLALCVDPRFALHLGRDDLATAHSLEMSVHDSALLQSELRRAIEKIRNGAACPQAVGAVELHGWLTALIGCPPQQRFFAEAAACHEGVNKDGCLKFDVSSSFRDFGESAPRFIAVDKLSRAVTAFDRALSHLVITFATEDSEMKRLSEGDLLHSGLLVRGLIGDNEAMRLLYPLRTTMILSQPELSAHLVEKTRAAVADGSLARVCAGHYGLSAAKLQQGIERLLAIQSKTLPLLPIEVHHLADAIESRIRLRKAAQALPSSAGPASHRRQALQLDLSMRAQTARQFRLAKKLKADFDIDPTKLFYIDNLLIDRIKALYGNDLEFLRRVLAGYIERHSAAQQSRNAANGSDAKG
ncbi:MAG: hypothetical protein FJ143_02750 [Deltaproteobacteria bacterium]|nr:hypothetical protein [Deltaproteobacteria bacterium]